MSSWHIFLAIILVVLFAFYALLAMLTSKSSKSAFRETMNSPIPMSFLQQETFDRSMRRMAKKVHLWQGWLMVVATVIFAILGPQLFVIAAVFCGCVASWHFGCARGIVV